MWDEDQILYIMPHKQAFGLLLSITARDQQSETLQL